MKEPGNGQTSGGCRQGIEERFRSSENLVNLVKEKL